MRNQNQPVAIEGYPFIGLFAFITLVFALLGWSVCTLLFLGLTLFAAYFFRNPDRYSDAEDAAILAPADGKVVYVGPALEERYFKSEVTKISIFMSVFNVHVNRVPMAGKVVDMFYNKGQFLNAAMDKASLHNEQSGMLLEHTSGRRMLVVQIAGLIARRIVTYPVVGDILQRGARYGLIRFGSRVDIYLEDDVDIQVTVGERVCCGETVLGFLK
ncbi:phosphatidylserine decarboxylase, putative [Syntrophotalea carbinolica DSM 2380]|uniref:Phosphatidylserine decarboxylase proenzyme n=1 Tax=Syntrophotalea carbinolica (strain DSM 2380 / NBRC 103641 / GraBd1) TaxID=338963 RepID=PSD_SYNC1|nr:phosphatidylserine decarboxylase family protein [Syntrophotalea carbinolica]Q3A3A8.1 RecName: Full=Phosphatidylserine decarboxylase proenzyme; Contains: RecName: Full=Phosphatidylserine decarboxylase alpha chain; Contains: RecName: Full=Phosphatidylserine decarboxylase beta chain [Syntrophotalea carbinolica DSM 2380]ABA89149.1 phosphatidylserine decarboxylase, putative [Syntrophotalea carbinolica DSM 2380]